MPTHHRVRAKKEGEPAEKVKGRRPSEIQIAQNLRRYVTEWMEFKKAENTFHFNETERIFFFVKQHEKPVRLIL